MEKNLASDLLLFSQRNINRAITIFRNNSTVNIVNGTLNNVIVIA